tara:strand:+ start:71 stop:307 length:237 start_codon:yes stop_codon:yes gene_type:complete
MKYRGNINKKLYYSNSKKISKLSDMHPMQIDALMNFIGVSLAVASALEDESAMEAVKESADDLIQMLGGHGIRMETKH